MPDRRHYSKSFEKTQREIILGLLQGPGHPWFTLEELSNKTLYSTQSVSAQLRHLRKAEYGGYRIERRLRESNGHYTTYEYCLGDAA